jgi:histidyl-tRNA synthetase
MKYADNKGIRFAIIAGPDERAAGEVTLRDLAQREQRRVGRAALAAEIQRTLESGLPS